MVSERRRFCPVQRDDLHALLRELFRDLDGCQRRDGQVASSLLWRLEQRGKFSNDDGEYRKSSHFGCGELYSITFGCGLLDNMHSNGVRRLLFAYWNGVMDEGLGEGKSHALLEDLHAVVG